MLTEQPIKIMGRLGGDAFMLAEHSFLQKCHTRSQQKTTDALNSGNVLENLKGPPETSQKNSDQKSLKGYSPPQRVLRRAVVPPRTKYPIWGQHFHNLHWTQELFSKKKQLAR
jgi:hypothetical protein